MKYYCIAEIDITDRSWLPDYLDEVTPMVERYGGRYLARTSKIERLEGEAPMPKIVLVIEWPSREAIDAFYDSEEYRPFREARIRGAKNEFLIVAGEDMAGRATGL